ncbi:MAG: phage tail family protein [Clostridia bacterium]|nr:phage tail family protein [Clostridia bacterium]
MVQYENAIGKLCFGNGSEFWNLTKISGLGLPEKTFQSICYANMPGQLTIAEKAEPRVITMRGDCCGGSGAFTEGMRILNKKGRLTFSSMQKTRCIEAYCSHFEIQNQHGVYTEFIIQFTCDDPYFTGAEPSQAALYDRRDLVMSSFETPCVFTERITGANVFNNGDVETEPVFTLACVGVGSPGETQGIRIENQTTGNVFFLDYVMQADEIITVDIPNRKIVSNIQNKENNYGNLMSFLSKDTFLNDIYLAVGDNEFTATNYSVGSEVIVTCSYSEKYLEAVM